MFGVSSILGIGKELIDKLIPDPQKKAEANYKLMELEKTGQLKELDIRMSAIREEAKSQDKWTSRARPSFLYVIYFMILMSLPMGVLHAIYPETAANIQAGVKSWLSSFPHELWYLFGVGYLGYSGARSYDKRNIVKS